jgi:prolipoprotein diacylglyceryl transferase
MVWDIDPEIFRVGPVAVRWYSLSFMIGFLIAYQYMLRIFARNNWGEDTPEVVSSLFTHIFLGTLIGARLGHCLFYEPEIYLAEPWKILMVWRGGLASHGGFIGVMIATYMFTRRHGNMSFFWLVDRVAPPAMLTGALIRVGNFFNSEIVGKVSDAPWAVTFKRIDNLPRHPAMLYESAFYFIIAFIGFFAIEKFRKKWADGAFLGLVLILGMSARFFVEFFKENQVAFENGLTLNMGQLLSIPFVFIGISLMTGKQQHNPALAIFSRVPPRKPLPQPTSIKTNPSKKAPQKNKKKTKRKK